MKTNGINIVKVGMQVNYRGSWGTGPLKTATIIGIELCESEHEKYGIATEQVYAKDLRRCCVDLSDNHWAYGYQIEEILG